MGLKGREKARNVNWFCMVELPLYFVWFCWLLTWCTRLMVSGAIYFSEDARAYTCLRRLGYQDGLSSTNSELGPRIIWLITVLIVWELLLQGLQIPTPPYVAPLSLPFES